MIWAEHGHIEERNRKRHRVSLARLAPGGWGRGTKEGIGLTFSSIGKFLSGACWIIVDMLVVWGISDVGLVDVAARDLSSKLILSRVVLMKGGFEPSRSR